MRATLNAIERELALTMRPPRALAGSRLLRLRPLLLAVGPATFPWRMGCGVYGPRCGAATAACLLVPEPVAAFSMRCAGVAMDVMWDLLVFLALVAVGLVLLNLLARRR